MTLGPVVQKVDNFIQQINPYRVDKIGAFIILTDWTTSKFYLLDKVIHSSYDWALTIFVVLSCVGRLIKFYVVFLSFSRYSSGQNILSFRLC